MVVMLLLLHLCNALQVSLLQQCLLMCLKIIFPIIEYAIVNDLKMP